MVYRHKKTGATITTACQIAGEDWEPVTVKAAGSQPEKAEKTPAKKTTKRTTK